MSKGEFPENLSQAILEGIMLVGGSGVPASVSKNTHPEMSRVWRRVRFRLRFRFWLRGFRVWGFWLGVAGIFVFSCILIAANKQTNQQTNEQTKQTDKQTDRRTNRQTNEQISRVPAATRPRPRGEVLSRRSGIRFLFPSFFRFSFLKVNL